MQFHHLLRCLFSTAVIMDIWILKWKLLGKCFRSNSHQLLGKLVYCRVHNSLWWSQGDGATLQITDNLIQQTFVCKCFPMDLYIVPILITWCNINEANAFWLALCNWKLKKPFHGICLYPQLIDWDAESLEKLYPPPPNKIDGWLHHRIMLCDDKIVNQAIHQEQVLPATFNYYFEVSQEEMLHVHDYPLWKKENHGQEAIISNSNNKEMKKNCKEGVFSISLGSAFHMGWCLLLRYLHQRELCLHCTTSITIQHAHQCLGYIGERACSTQTCKDIELDKLP